MMRVRVPAVVATAVLMAAYAGPARAQNSYGAYLRQSNQIEAQANASTQRSLNSINRAIAQDQRQSNGILMGYVRQNYPRLRAQYVYSGASRRMGFMQFANQELMSHATVQPTNNTFAAGQAAHQAQVDRFNRMQSTHQAQVSAGQTMIQSGQAASDANAATIERSTQGSIRGNSVYVNPQSGRGQYMPTYSPGYSRAGDGTLYRQDQDGRYYQQQGSGWVAVPGR